MIREALTLDRLRVMDPGEAAAYFVARRGEGLTPSEEELLAEWLAEDERHAEALDRVERAWSWLDDPEGHEVIEAVRAHALAPQIRARFRWMPVAAAAAVLFLVALVSILLRAPDWGSTPGGTGGDAAIRYASAAGQVRTFTLSDGSRMTLDADSEVTARLGAASRSLELGRGRALFAVAPDRSRPFSVTARDRRVVAVGTRFDVGLAATTLTVNVLEGRVTVGPASGNVQPVELGAGEQFVERGGRPLVRRTGPQVENAAAWAGGLLHFDDAPLAEAVEEVNRYSTERITIRDPEVAAMRISGEFRAGDAMRFAATVSELHPVRAVQRANGIELVADK